MSLLNRFLTIVAKGSAVKTAVRTISTNSISNVKETKPIYEAVNVNLLNNRNFWIWKESPLKGAPPLKSLPKPIELPGSVLWIPPEDSTIVPVRKEAPASIESEISKQAVRLIVIRRKKMKKHKLRKLRKKMKFEWAKRRQKREMRKEKAFQAELLTQIREAEKFSAEKYVEEKIRLATEKPPEPFRHFHKKLELNKQSK